MAQQENNQAMILQLPNGQKVYLDLQHSTDTTAIWSFVAAMIASIVIAIWYGRKSFKLTKQSFDTVIKQIESSEKIMVQTNKDLIEQQKILKIRELQILNRNNTLDKVRELISGNLYLAGNLQNQIEIGINEIRQQKFDNFLHSRRHGDFKIVLNNYQSSINRLRVYLGNENQHSEELNKHFRKMQLLSWSLYTADMNEPTLNDSLDQWMKEFKVGEVLVQNYLNDELKSIYK